MALKPLGKIGIDVNEPTMQSGLPAPQLENPDIIAHTQVYFVRLNFILRPWSDPDDPNFIATYDRIIDKLLERGIAIYALVGSQATPIPDMGDILREPHPSSAAEEWINLYTRCFKTIVERFHDRIWVFESFNEPNDWHGGNKAWVHPYWMAKILRDIYLAVKPRFDVTIVSGPLLAHDLPTGPDDGSRYLDALYRNGIDMQRWEEVRKDLGTYPLDGIGYHLYVCTSPQSTPNCVRATFKKYIDAIWKVVTKYEGANTTKGIYISEFGWPSDNGEEFQASMIRAALEYLAGDHRVKAAVLFCLQDFADKTYGLYRSKGFTVAYRKTKPYWVFRSMLTKLPTDVLPVGVGRDKDGTLYWPIVECYLRHGGEAALGVPFDNGGGVPVHRWGDGWVQDFRTPSGRRESIIMLKRGEKRAYLLYGPIREEYIYRQGGPLGPLGYPVTDVYLDEWGLPACKFEGGEIVCKPTVIIRGGEK